MPHSQLSTRQAAALLGVGTTSIKRWADEGVLACEKTVGGHRRFSRGAVLVLKHAAAGETREASSGTAAGWVERLVAEDVAAAGRRAGARPAQARRLVASRRRARPGAARARRAWETGALSVIQEHVASAHLARALAPLRRPPAGAAAGVAGAAHDRGGRRPHPGPVARRAVPA
jgi:excisionase family DNA binding protein